MTKFYIIRGTSGSGKTTLAQSLTSDDFEWAEHVEADQYFMQNGEYQFDASKLGRAHEWCKDKVEDCFKKDYDVIVVSNTFTTKKELRPYFVLAKKYGVMPVVLTVQSGFKNIHNVPEEVLAKQQERFDYLAPIELTGEYFGNETETEEKAD